MRLSSSGSADTVRLSPQKLSAWVIWCKSSLVVRNLLLLRDPDVHGSSGPRHSPPPRQDWDGRVFEAGEASFVGKTNTCFKKRSLMFGAGSHSVCLSLCVCGANTEALVLELPLRHVLKTPSPSCELRLPRGPSVLQAVTDQAASPPPPSHGRQVTELRFFCAVYDSSALLTHKYCVVKKTNQIHGLQRLFVTPNVRILGAIIALALVKV